MERFRSKSSVVHPPSHIAVASDSYRARLSTLTLPLLQVRFCVWLPAQLSGMLAIAALPSLSSLRQAASSAVTSGQLAQYSLGWQTAWRLALGLLLPNTVMWLLERLERRQFATRVSR